MVPTSSPDLPTVQDMLSQKQKRPAIRGGTESVPIPNDADSTFTSARDLWQAARRAEVNQLSPSTSPKKVIMVDDIDTPVCAVEHAPEEESPLRKSYVPKGSANPSSPGIFELVDEEVPSRQPWKKYKPKTPGKYASPRGASVEKESPYLVSNQMTSERRSRETTPSQDPPILEQIETTKCNAEEPLLLEPAMIRRKDWTPPTEKSTVILDSDTSPSQDDLHATDENDPANSFGNIVSAYMCANATTQEIAAHQSDTSSVQKMKPAFPEAESTDDLLTTRKSVTRPKAMRKKARTITGLATAAYRHPGQVEPKDGVRDVSPLTKPKPLSKTSKNTKPRKGPSKAKKKQEPPKPVLFSPETALRQVAKQDFVFGTSSQLATEQSPTFLRDLHLTMKNSNQLDYVDFTTPLNSDAIEPPEGRSRLWDAAARDADGDLFDVEVVNLTEASPQFPKTPGSVDPFGYFKGDDEPPPSHTSGSTISSDNGNESVADLSDILPTIGSRATYTATNSSNALSGMGPSVQQTGKLSVTLGVTSSPELASKESTAPRAANHHSQPTFEHFTDAQLSKEISRYGFKPVKRRSAMIALLNQCWQQTGDASQGIRMLSTAAVISPTKRPRGRPRKDSVEDSRTQEPPPSAQAPETPKKPRGRPRKDSQTTPGKQAVSKRTTTPTRKRTAGSNATPKKAKAVKVIEIPDSESELADTLDSSPHSSPSSTFSSPRQVDLAMSIDNDTELSLTMTPTDVQACLFTHITKAVTTAPRTTDPANPSWHEKILLYDPIVLEDLASWLNSGHLSRVGYDEEVNPVELKKWCESKSICCLWKVNLRGKERKRY
ncbi:5'-flap endonuclease [Metarhizium acridum]|uniref:5'-flap endonuclease n=1 Tax=Metarhizium acridum TaxID=92637 RepID=UPI001C6C1DD8|nr:5'-flap endonuclease [Metarhizium acridum]